jgi:hypothetical protein
MTLNNTNEGVWLLVFVNYGLGFNFYVENAIPPSRELNNTI